MSRSVRRLAGNPQFGEGGTAYGPQGRVETKALLDVDNVKRIRKAVFRQTMYKAGMEHGDETVEKDEIFFYFKGAKNKMYNQHGFAFGLTSLNNCEIGADAAQNFPDDVEAQKQYVMERLVVLGAAFSRLDSDKVTGGLPGTGVSITVAGTLETLALEDLAPGALVRAVPPDPKLYGKWKRRHGISPYKATLELVPYDNQTAGEQWEMMWRERYAERLAELEGREDKRYESEKYRNLVTAKNMCRAFEDAFIFNGVAFLHSLIAEGILTQVTFANNYNPTNNDGATGNVGDARLLADALAFNFGLEKGATPAGAFTRNNYQRHKLRMLNRAFFTDATDKREYQIRDADARLKRWQYEYGRTLNYSFQQLNSFNKASIYGTVIKPADAGTTATVLR